MMRQMLLIVVVGALVNAVTGDRRPRCYPPCCEKVSNAPIKNIESFTRLHAHQSCLDAIVFTTKDNKNYCTDPKARWVAKKLKDLKPQ
ncbi:C-C motif chemokine 8-like isoform X2 [Alosa sapidissima]|uniref:C-C motif chemokine 8-like isoform X2 n=1 Tax=Alosa sapidissima TaxID=34773 RepID=UPI001C07FB4F|nr:C-C motif chemokine 8-like isoform X2 [Alosa sapidissima]